MTTGGGTMLRVLGCWVTCAGLFAAACADLPSGDRFANWNRLHLKGHAGPFFSGRVEMSLRTGVDERVLSTETTARLFGATVLRSRTETVLDGRTGSTKSYSAYSSKRGRRYSFGDDRYTIEKLRPLKGDRSGADDWELKSRAEFPYPVEGDRPVPVHDYYGMLLHLRDLGLERPGDEAPIFVATGDGPQRFVVRVAEARSQERSYVDLATGEKRTASLREFRLRLQPDDPDSDEGFLDMEGETEVWVEARSKTPLEISGKIPKVPGRVRLVLSAMD